MCGEVVVVGGARWEGGVCGGDSLLAEGPGIGVPLEQIDCNLLIILLGFSRAKPINTGSSSDVDLLGSVLSRPPRLIYKPPSVIWTEPTVVSRETFTPLIQWQPVTVSDGPPPGGGGPRDTGGSGLRVRRRAAGLD